MEIICKQAESAEELTAISNRTEIKSKVDDDPSITQTLMHPNPTMQLLLTSKPLIHRPEVGINPLVDAAAYLFSMMGRLKHIKSYKNLDKLYDELAQEIRNFQETIETYPYNAECLAEYLPVSSYALCVTLDDIIASTPWGGQGKWDNYSLAKSFNHDQLSRESFLIILERLVIDASVYIDMLEFIYICLNLGFKCHYNVSTFGHDQLEQIINSLYRRIRVHRGNFNKTLSPYMPSQRQVRIPSKKIPPWLVITLASSFFVTLFAAGKYMVHHLFN